MAEASSGTKSRRFKIAFAFPGSCRDAIDPVVHELVRTFGSDHILYDRFHSMEFTREDAPASLVALFSRHAELIVVALGPGYFTESWGGWDWSTVHRLIAQVPSRVMFVTLGELETPEGSAAGVNIEGRPAAEVAAAVYARWQHVQGPQVDVERLRMYASDLLVGREDELQALQDAWDVDDPSRPRVLVWAARPGMGKTALVASWLLRLEQAHWPKAEKVFGWSFGGQGQSEPPVSSDLFLAEALTFFGDPDTANGPRHPADKTQRLLHLIRQHRTLLILDGLESFQHTSPNAPNGRLKDQALAGLLKGLAAKSAGLCVVTTTDAAATFDDFGPRVHVRTLAGLTGTAGRTLLEGRGVHGAKDRLEAASETVGGHPLTLNLLGRYLADAHQGDGQAVEQIEWDVSAPELSILKTYVDWLENESEAARQALECLRLMGLFDRPAPADVFEALLKPPMIPGLTEATARLRKTMRMMALKRLEAAQLLIFDRTGHTPAFYDTHPMLRAYFARVLRQERPEAWRAGHARLHAFLTETEREAPRTRADLQPWYQAVRHGSLAGQQKHACYDVYVKKILRGTGQNGFYSTRQLGAYGSDLEAIATFFDAPWYVTAEVFDLADQSWLLSEAALCLRTLGRLQEAQKPMRVALQTAVDDEAWKPATARAGSLSELSLTLGDLRAALDDARRSVIFADRSGDPGPRIINRTSLADAQHQAGRRDAAQAAFETAEAMQADVQPDYPRLYSVRGYRYCDFLLGPAERAAWARKLQQPAGCDVGEVRAICRAVNARAEQTLQWSMAQGASTKTLALDHLSLGRATLYQALVTGGHPNFARASLDTAIHDLRKTRAQAFLPTALLARALLRVAGGVWVGKGGAQEDLDEAWDVAEASAMRLHMVDIHLGRARLFCHAPTYPWKSAEDDLQQAKQQLDACGYERRRGEWEDAARALRGKQT